MQWPFISDNGLNRLTELPHLLPQSLVQVVLRLFVHKLSYETLSNRVNLRANPHTVRASALSEELDDRNALFTQATCYAFEPCQRPDRCFCFRGVAELSREA